MARYIDADKLIEHLKDNLRECGNPDVATQPRTYGCSLGLKGALSYAETLPTTDVVEVVRCKDCKYWKYKRKGIIDNYIGDCHNDNLYSRSEYKPIMRDTDFCSYGEIINDKV